MRVAPRLLRAASPIALAAMLAVPSFAAAHSSLLGAGDAPVDAAAVVDHGEELDEALAGLPRETASGACRLSEQVDGLGSACRTSDGAFRVVLADGTTMTTHGTDAPLDPTSRAAAAPHLPDTQAAIDGASVADIECTTAPGDRKVELVYARPSDKVDRSATIADPMRQALYEASAFLDAEAQALDATQGRRIRALCSGGVPVVHTAVVRASGGGGGDFSDIVSDLVAQGYPAPTSNTTSTRRFMVFYDDQSANGAAGVGGMWLDDSAGPDNLNNLGARYAVEFDWAVSRLPHWDVFLHEISHNMGAVADAAPDSSQAGHCLDGLDLMCYPDGGIGTYSSTVCAVERYDCGADTYFHPSPPFGSWLSTHWNVGSPDNHWLAQRDLAWDDGGIPDVTPPSVPTALGTSSITTSSISLSWGASTDDRSQVRYRVGVDRLVDGAWQLETTWQPVSTTGLAVTALATGTTWRFRVLAYDQAGNQSTEAVAQAATLFTPPVTPGSASLTVVDGDTATAAWTAGTASAGVAGHEVQLQRSVDAWMSVGQFAGTTTTVDGLATGGLYRIRVRTVAADGVVSGWRTSLYVAMPVTQLAGGGAGDALLAPVVSASATAPNRATITWSASPGAAGWNMSIVHANGTRRSVDGLEGTSLALSGLAPGASYTVSVTAFAADGRVSDAGVSALRMPRDTTAPGIVRFLAPRYSGTTMTSSWRAATDNVGVARYQLQRRVGARWIAVSVAPRATRAAVRGVRRGSSVVLRVRAIDAAGNAGRWATATVRRR